jgi:3-oxoacyl-ACP reductase-like protein
VAPAAPHDAIIACHHVELGASGTDTHRGAFNALLGDALRPGSTTAAIVVHHTTRLTRDATHARVAEKVLRWRACALGHAGARVGPDGKADGRLERAHSNVRIVDKMSAISSCCATRCAARAAAMSDPRRLGRRMGEPRRRNTNVKVEGSVALVTGASRGLGRALVHALVEAGASRVYATARDVTRVARHERIVPLALDITNEHFSDAMAELTHKPARIFTRRET